jgi:hypothetical protein
LPGITIKLLLEDDAYYDLRANAPPYFFSMYFATKIAVLAPLLPHKEPCIVENSAQTPSDIG